MMRLFIEEFSKEFKSIKYAVLFYNRENFIAQKLYERVGFITTNIIMDGSVFAYAWLNHEN